MILPLKTVVRRSFPVGKTKRVCGSWWGSVVVCVSVVVVVSGVVVVNGKGKERNVDAREGPVMEVPWSNIRVDLCVERGATQKVGG